ncbi:MAG: 50S ribosomal protein L16 [Candidatus Altiarchaeota archaeon]
MGLRPAHCYRWDSPAYTRISNNPKDAFIVGVPGSRLTRLEMGNPKGKFDVEISIVSEQNFLIRSNALEAARKAINKVLEDKVGSSNYKFLIRAYPHHVLRENIMATGAGADRVQSGMRASFGKPIGTAARVKKGRTIISVYVKNNEETIKNVKEALKKGLDKLPGKTKIAVRNIK